MQNQNISTFFLIIGFPLMLLFSCHPNAETERLGVFTNIDSVALPKVIKAGKPIVNLLGNNPPPKVVKLSEKPSAVVNQADFYIPMQNFNTEQGLALSSIRCGFKDKAGEPMVSHERIYQYIRIDKKNGGDLYKSLRHKLKHRKRPVGGKFIPIKDRVSIDERPEAINNKERFGDWEIDTIIGKDGKGAIVTIVERSIAFFMMKNLPNGKNAESLAETVIELLLPYKKHVHSITANNGTEFADHKTIAHSLDLNFYFAHPYSSWERGLSEYTNKLTRQYIPKKSVFADFPDEYILDKQYRINRRPRGKLNFESPKTIFYNLVA